MEPNPVDSTNQAANEVIDFRKTALDLVEGGYGFRPNGFMKALNAIIGHFNRMADEMKRRNEETGGRSTPIQ